jgi:hypothetical protein
LLFDRVESSRKRESVIGVKSKISTFAASVACLLFLAHWARADTELFFYPPPLKLSDGSLLASPVTVDERQITSEFPTNKEMSGVVLIVYWSTLCPTQAHCDFSIIQNTLDYWAQRQKKVVLSVATVGFPMQAVGSPSGFVNATPDWLLDEVRTFTEPSRTISSTIPAPQVSTRFPSYFDPRFVGAVRQLVQEISRFDGHRALAQVRISTGLLGEDNPSVDGYRSRDPEFTERRWIEYSKGLLSIYERYFRKTQLELDIGYVSWARVLADSTAREEADAFIDQLISDHIFIAFNGLDSNTDKALGAEDASGALRGPARSIRYLLAAKSHGESIGLEASGPIYVPKMQDASAIAEAIRKISPNRLVLFGTDAGILSQSREGESPSNASSRSFVPQALHETSVKRLNRVLDALTH